MPGIVALFSKEKSGKCLYEVERLIEGMGHYPDYEQGIFSWEEEGVYVGWICKKGSFNDRMPIYNKKRDILVFLSGEIFIDEEKIRKMPGWGDLEDLGNAQWVALGYEDKGEEIFKELNGWFSGIILDKRKGKTILFNDRFGMEKLFFGKADGEWLFSSEAKALTAWREELRAPDFDALGEFFVYGHPIGGRTFQKNVSLVPGGSKWVIKKAETFLKESYFDPRLWEEQEEVDRGQFLGQLNEKFRAILPRYLKGEKPLGMSLTGGLDSRIILANIGIPLDEIRFYTFGNNVRKTLDEKIARSVTASLYQPHESIVLQRDFFDDFEKYAEKTIFFSDGYHEAFGAHDLYFNEIAREISPVRLSGKFGSEVLRWTTTFKPSSFQRDLFQDGFQKYIDGALERYGEAIARNSLSFTLFHDAPFHEYGRIKVENARINLRTPFMDNDLLELLYRTPRDMVGEKTASLNLIHRNNPALMEIPTDRGVVGNRGFLRTQLGRLYQEGMFRVEYFFSEGMPSRLSLLNRIVIKAELERRFLGNHRYLHYSRWIREELKDFVMGILGSQELKIGSIVKKKSVEEMLYKHLHKGHNFTREINRLVSLEIIRRIL